jgi:hypothetical protein
MGSSILQLWTTPKTRLEVKTKNIAAALSLETVMMSNHSSGCHWVTLEVE